MSPTDRTVQTDIDVLVVEDSETQAVELEHVLKKHGYRVRVALDGTDALKYLKERKPTIVISDILMPKMDGYELCRSIKKDKSLRDIPVVLLTSLSDPRDVIGGLQCGADNFATKPWKEDFLISRIESVLVNKKLRQKAPKKYAVEISFGGRVYEIPSDRLQMMDLLFSSVENAFEKNRDLETMVKGLQATEHTLKQAKDQAEADNLAKSRFLVNISHEIRTTLNSVIGFTDLLLNTSLNDEQIDYVKTLKRSADGLLSLIDNVRDFSKIEVGQLELESVAFDPKAMAHDVCEMIRPRVASRLVEILCHIGDRVPAYVRGDPGRFRQILLNLMGNAAKSTGSGEIELSFDILEEQDDQVKLYVRVRDTGTGIPKEQLGSIFEVFQWGDSFETGENDKAGLGLSVCKGLATAMGGDVWAESEVGKGSIFYFTAVVEKSEDESMHEETKDTLQILLAEGDPVNQKEARMMLTQAGCQVEVANDCLEAVVKYMAGADKFDLIFIDVQTPEMDSIKTTKSIRSWEKKLKARSLKRAAHGSVSYDKSSPQPDRVPIVAMAAHAMEGEWEEFLEVGVDDYVAKPMERGAVLEIIEKWLAT